MVVRDLVMGKTRKAIARDRGRSLRQLHRDIGEIRSKLNAENDMQLAILAYATGAVDSTALGPRRSTLPTTAIRSRHMDAMRTASR